MQPNLRYKVRKTMRMPVRVLMAYLRIANEKYGPTPYEPTNHVTKRELEREICYGLDGKHCRKLTDIPLMERDDYIRDDFLKARIGSLINARILDKLKPGCYRMTRRLYLIIYAKTGGNPVACDPAWLSELLSAEYEI